MKAELASASSLGPEGRENICTGSGGHQTGNDLTQGVSAFGIFAGVILANIKLLALGPVVAGLVAFGIASVWPKSYTSVVYLNLDETGARVADTRMRSTPVLDKVLAEFKAPRDTLEARRRFVEENRRLVVAAGDTQKTSKLFRMEYSDRDPAVAQKVNSLFLEAWLESTRPPPDRHAAIEAEIERVETRSKSISQLIERLEKDSPTLVAQSLQGELATPILGLIAKRDEDMSNLITLKGSLNGTSRDVIFGAPDLPEEPSWPQRRMITVLAVVVTELLLFLFVMLHRFRPTWI